MYAIVDCDTMHFVAFRQTAWGVAALLDRPGRQWGGGVDATKEDAIAEAFTRARRRNDTRDAADDDAWHAAAERIKRGALAGFRAHFAGKTNHVGTEKIT